MDGTKPGFFPVSKPVVAASVALAVALVVVFGGAISKLVAEEATITIDIAGGGIGVPPSDFEFWQIGPGGPGRWAVVRDPTAVAGAAIEQFSADHTEHRYPIAVYKPISVENFGISVRFKIVEGTMQAAGLAFRLFTPSNYYVVVASALESRIDLFRVVEGKSTRIAGVDADVMRQRWHALRIIARGHRYLVFLDNRVLFTAQDRTFSRSGYLALWTEEDNVTRFDSIEITPLPRSE